MARRQYVSFLGERRRDIAFSDRGRDPLRWVLLVVAVLAIAVSLWWFGFREVDKIVVTERVLNETTVATLLTPSAIEGSAIDVAEASVDCPHLIEEWNTFQGAPDRTGCVSTRLITSPEIMWRTEIGILGWRNNPVIEQGSIYVGSAGVVQFVSDRRDGIYSLDLATGAQRWLYTTELDVNSVAVSNGIVVATGDEGRIWALSAREGTLLWTKDPQVGVLADPLFFGDNVIVADGKGQVAAYNARNGDPVWQTSVDGAVRGGVSADDEHIYVAGESGDLLVLTADGQIVWRADIQGRGAGAADARIFAAPTITDTMVIITLVRSDLGGEPAILALDKETGEELWRGVDQAGIKTQWANIRSSPAVAGDYVLFGEGYSEDLVVMDIASGETSWSAKLGDFCFPHWPSVAVDNGLAILARHDGGLYAVNLTTREIAWSIYLGQADGTGAFPAGFDEPGFCQAGPKEGFSILSSPAISPEGVIVVGTLEGKIIAVGDSDWEN